jgi:hypothetical protein
MTVPAPPSTSTKRAGIFDRASRRPTTQDAELASDDRGVGQHAAALDDDRAGAREQRDPARSVRLATGRRRREPTPRVEDGQAGARTLPAAATP